jgi:hypothetical protein
VIALSFGHMPNTKLQAILGGHVIFFNAISAFSK